MRKPSRETLEHANRDLEQRNHLLYAAMYALALGEVTWCHRYTDDQGGRYRFGYANVDAPDGGLFIVRFDQPSTGQRPTFTVKPLEDIRSAEYWRLRGSLTGYDYAELEASGFAIQARR